MKILLLTSLVFSSHLLHISLAQQPSVLEEQLQEGLLAEELHRNYADAVKAYRRAVDSHNPASDLVATALFHLATSHERRAEDQLAIAAYQEVIRRFPKDVNYFNRALTGLQTLGAAEAGKSQVAESEAETEALARIETLIQDSPDLLNDKARPPLHAAAWNNQLRLARRLLEAGADIHLEANIHPELTNPNYQSPHHIAPNEFQGTPLFAAVNRGHLNMCRLLVQHGARVDEKTWDAAARRHRKMILTFLMTKGSPILAEFSQPLAVLAARGELDLLDRMLKISRPKPESLKEALRRARSPATFRRLVQAGAKPDGTVLMSFVKQVIAGDCNPDSPTLTMILDEGIWDMEAFVLAVEKAPELLPKLLENVPDPNLKTDNKATLLGLASVHLRPEAIRILIEKGADVDAPSQHTLWKTTLTCAPLALAFYAERYHLDPAFAEADMIQVVDRLLDAGADIHAMDQDGKTILLHAIDAQFLNRAALLPWEVLDRLLAERPQMTRKQADLGIRRLTGHSLGLHDTTHHPRRSNLPALPRTITLRTDPRLTNLQMYLLLQTEQLRFRVTTLFQPDPSLNPSLKGRELYKQQPENNQGPVKLSSLLYPYFGTFASDRVAVYRRWENRPQIFDMRALGADKDGSDDPLMNFRALCFRDPLIDLSSIVLLTPANEPAEPLKAGAEQNGFRRITVRWGRQSWQGLASLGTPGQTCYDPNLGRVQGRTLEEILQALHIRPDLRSGNVVIRRTVKLNNVVGHFRPVVDEVLADQDVITLGDFRPDGSQVNPEADGMEKDWEGRGNAIWLSRQNRLFTFPLCPREKLQVRPDRTTNINLAEFVALAYANTQFVLPSPDLGQIQIFRDGKMEQTVDFTSLHPGRIPELKLGDVVEIPAVTNAAMPWTGLSEATRWHLDRLLKRSIILDDGGTVCTQILLPEQWSFPVEQAWRRARPGPQKADNALRSLSGQSVLEQVRMTHGKEMQLMAEIRSAGGFTSQAWRYPSPAGQLDVLPLIEPDDHLTISVSPAGDARQLMQHGNLVCRHLRIPPDKLEHARKEVAKSGSEIHNLKGAFHSAYFFQTGNNWWCRQIYTGIDRMSAKDAATPDGSGQRSITADTLRRYQEEIVRRGLPPLPVDASRPDVKHPRPGGLTVPEPDRSTPTADIENPAWLIRLDSD